MLLVLSSIADPAMPACLERWRASGTPAEALTAHDLAQPGWKLELDGEPTLVVRGVLVPAAQITAIITRLPEVTANDLPFVHDDDRAYAASEMQAFLLALLTSVRCPVLNRAHPGNLAGPAWAAEQWVACAARAGVHVRPAVRRSYAGGQQLAHAPELAPRFVHVVGDQAFGDPALHDPAIAIARAAGTELLRVAFDPGGAPAAFTGADPWIDLADPQITEAIRKKVTS